MSLSQDLLSPATVLWTSVMAAASSFGLRPSYIVTSLGVILILRSMIWLLVTWQRSGQARSQLERMMQVGIAYRLAHHQNMYNEEIAAIFHSSLRNMTLEERLAAQANTQAYSSLAQLGSANPYVDLLGRPHP